MKLTSRFFILLFLAVCCSFAGARSPGIAVAQLLQTPSPAPRGFIYELPGGGPTPTPLPSGVAPPTPGATPTPYHHHIGVGAWVNPSTANPTPASIAALETYIGRTLNYSMHYDSFLQTFPSTSEAADITAGRTPVVSMDCGTPANIENGSEDAALAVYAAQINSLFITTVELRYCPEANLAYRGISASDFISSWTHMYAIMAPIAPEIRWFWCPGSSSNMMSYYPGDAYVTDAGFDQYDTTRNSFLQTMSRPYATIAAVNKPFIIGETGALAAKGQGSYLTASTIATINANLPKISGVLYFDGSGTGGDWTLSSAGLAAFKSFAVAAN